MKKLFLIITVLTFIGYAQERYVGELRIDLANYGSSWNVTFTLSSVSARWDENYELTEDYEVLSDNITSPFENSSFFDHILDPSERNPVFAIGLYKISAIESGVEKAYFYMDWRTSNWSSSLDVQFKYDFSTKNFRDYYSNEVIDYSYQTLWDLTNNSLVTSGLEDYWQNCLVAIPSTDNHPMLVWGPYPYNIGIYEYRIYRNYGGWELLATVDDDEFTYVDETLSLTQPGGQAGTDVYYYVKGVYTENPPNPIETSASNTAIVNVPGDDIDKKSVSNNKNENFKYNLTQNFPNPFNPSTIISYSLPVSGQVTLKVFDILGSEVAELVNEQKEAGKHTIKFDASKLTSGIYFYQIKAGDYSETRKLILQK